MIILAATTDKLQLITGSARTIDVHVSFMDVTSAFAVTRIDRKNTPITTATTTDICLAPSGSNIRNIKTVFIRNKDTNPCDVTVFYEGSTTDFDSELIKVTLAAGEQLEYIEGVGWFVVRNVSKIDVKLRVTADVDNATTSFADVTGLTYAVESGKFYGFEAHIFHIENAATTGARFGINGPSMTAMRVSGFSVFAGSLTAATFNALTADVAAVDTSILGVTTSSAATPQVVPAIMSGYINPSANGTFAVRSQSEVAVAAGVKVKAGSWCRLWEFDN